MKKLTIKTYYHDGSLTHTYSRPATEDADMDRKLLWAKGAPLCASCPPPQTDGCRHYRYEISAEE